MLLWLICNQSLFHIEYVLNIASIGGHSRMTFREGTWWCLAPSVGVELQFTLYDLLLNYVQLYLYRSSLLRTGCTRMSNLDYGISEILKHKFIYLNKNSPKFLQMHCIAVLHCSIAVNILALIDVSEIK